MTEEPTANRGTAGPSPAVVVVGVVFAAILALTATAYTVAVSVVNVVTVDLLGYPIAGIAPFVVISGAILTIPVIVPTALISVKRLS
jgi:hypothetical protein